MSNRNPLVSVQVLTFNHINYIKECLDGILMQKTDFPFEVIVGDDCSTDGTTELVLKYQNNYPDKVKVITHKENMGFIENSQSVNKASRGKYIAFCDGDDYWNDPYKLKKQISFLESHRDYGMVYSDIYMIDEYNETIEPTTQYKELKKQYKSGYIFGDVLKSCFINTLTVVVRKDTFDRIHSIVANDKEKYWFIYDYWWWMHISKEYKIKFIDEKTATYRIHPNGLHNTNSFYDVRSSLAKFEVIRSLNKEDIVSKENKNIIGKIAGSMIFNPKIGIKNNLLALNIFIKYPPSIPFIFSIMKKKIKR